MSDPIRVSPSRIGTYADCGFQFHLKYIEGVKPEKSGSAALFGKVMHAAREVWCLDREQKMVPLTEQAWVDVCKDDPAILGFVREYQGLSKKAIRLEHKIRTERPEIKAVRMTRDWKQSDLAKQIDRLNDKWLPALENATYRFQERDPLPGLYDESLVLARRYEEANRDLPNAYATEVAFEFEWHGFLLNGYIDEIRPTLDPDTGEQNGVGVVDAKTYRNDPVHTGKDWRQLTFYDLALRHLYYTGGLDVPLDKFPIYQGIDKMRLGEWMWFSLGEAEHRRLLFELKQWDRAVRAQIFLPAAKTCNANYCDFSKQCIHHHSNAATPLETIRVA